MPTWETDRTRVVTKTASFSGQATFYWRNKGLPFLASYDYWICDAASVMVTAALGTAHTEPIGPFGSAVLTGLDYGYTVSTGGTPVFVKLGTASLPYPSGDQDGVFQWEWSGTFSQTETRVEIRTEGLTFSEMITETVTTVSIDGGFEFSSRTGATLNGVPLTGSFGFAEPMTLTGFARNRYHGFNYDPSTVGGQANINSFNAVHPAFSLGAASSFDVTYNDGEAPAGSQGSGLAFSCPAGSGTYRTLTIDPPAAHVDASGEIRKLRDAPANLTVEVVNKRIGGDLSPEPTDVTVVIGSEITGEGVSTTRQSIRLDRTITGSLSEVIPLGGYRIDGAFGVSGGSGGTAYNGFDTTFTYYPVTRRVYVRWQSATPAVSFAGSPGPYIARERGRMWQALRVTQAAQLYMERSPFITSGNTGWKGGAGTTVIETGGVLRITSSATAATAFIQRLFAVNGLGGTFGVPPRIIGGRYIRVRCRSVGSANKKLSFRGLLQNDLWPPAQADASNRHEILTGADGQWGERVFDLLHPLGAIDRTKGYEFATPAINQWLIFLDPSTTYEIEWIRWERNESSPTDPQLSVLPLRSGGWVFSSQLMLGVSEGIRTLNLSAGTGIGGPLTLSQVAGYVTTTPDGYNWRLWSGWLAEDLAAAAPDPITTSPLPSNTLLTNNRPSWWLHGAGLIEGTTGALTPLVDQNADQVHSGGGLVIYAQPADFAAQFYPGAGEFLAGPGAAYGGNTTIRFAEILRGQIEGVVLGSDGSTADLPPIDLERLDPPVGPFGTPTPTGEDGGHTGTPRVPDGWVLSGQPYERGGTNAAPTRPGEGPTLYRARLRTDDPVATRPKVDLNNVHRQRRHVLFVAPPVRKGTRIDNLAHPTLGYFARVWMEPGTGNAILFKRTSAAPGPQAASDFLATVTIADGAAGALNAKLGSPALALDPTTGQLLCRFHAYPLAGGDPSVYESSSDDEGATWSTPVVAINNASLPAYAQSLHGDLGALLATAYRPTAPGSQIGNIVAVYRDPGDAPPYTEFTFQYRDGSNNLAPLPISGTDGYAITQEFGGQARWWLSCVFSGESAVSEWYSSDEGRTFTRLT